MKIKPINKVNLEKRVRDILKNNDWEVSSNLHYTDPNTKKPREKDIIATSIQLKNNDILRYHARLFVECKYLPTETKIHLEDTDMNKEENVALVYDIPLVDILKMENDKVIHLYKYTEVFKAKDSKDHLYKAINQNLQSFDAFRKNTSENKGIYYLIVVYDGKLKFRNEDRHNALVKIETLDDTYNLPHKKCFIELVSADQFKDLLKKIKEDLREINERACFNYKMEKNRIDEKRKRIQKDRCGY